MKNLYFLQKRQLVIALTFMVITSAFAQLVNPNENHKIPLSNNQFVYDKQPAVSVYVTPEAASSMPSALLNDNNIEFNDVTVWDNSSENHLLVMSINTVRKNLTMIVYDENGKRVMLETLLIREVTEWLSTLLI